MSTIRLHWRGHLRSILCDLRKSWKTGPPSIKKKTEQFLRHASYDPCHATGGLSLWGTLSGQVPGRTRKSEKFPCDVDFAGYLTNQADSIVFYLSV